MLSTVPAAPSFEDVRAAATRLRGKVHRTPVLHSREFDARVGAQVFFKCENFQRAGAFKARGALNAVLSLDAVTAPKGVVTHSSGNHAAALALAARERRIPAHIVVPEDTVRIKIDAVRRYGAHLTFCAPNMAARESAASTLLTTTGGTLVHPFNDPLVIAGQGTAALELLEEMDTLDILMAPVSGGGLLSGTTLAAFGINPAIRVIGAEPANADDARRSLISGTRVHEGNSSTIADGLRAYLGPMAFHILSRHHVSVVTATEDQIVAATRLIWDVLKIVIEPSCAVPVAALLAGNVPDIEGRRVGVILSGGNVDLDALPWFRS